METGDRKPDYGSDSENDELECKGMNIYEKEFYMEEKLENRAVYKQKWLELLALRDMTKMVVVNAAKKDKIGKDMKNLTE
jgi:hypothetical protein